jgi:cyclopropane-fatty-acyl-phospholipid synthase
VLARLLKRMIRTGRMRVEASDGRTLIEVGDKTKATNPDVAVRLRGMLTPFKLALNPDLYLGEAYMSGALEIRRGSLWDLMELIGRNGTNVSGQASWLNPLVRSLRHATHRAISPKLARRNAARHYDLSLALYRQFLDDDLQYSCAYFPDPSISLEDAQQAKKRHIIAKLRLEPGQHVLDVGCGWGGLAMAIARAADVHVRGITLSEEQLRVCRKRVREAGLDSRVTIELRDYREVVGQFDRIVSVGMFEHVGLDCYDAFFSALSRLLANNGIALLHTIGQRGRPVVSNAWMTKYIFPGGYVPAASQLTGAIERAGLWLTDLEILRLHYAETLKRWRERFMTRAAFVEDLYDARFVRMWEFYLAGCEMSFRFGDLMVMQAQLTKRVDAAPLTRDYMVDEERALSGWNDRRGVVRAASR